MHIKTFERKSNIPLTRSDWIPLVICSKENLANYLFKKQLARLLGLSIVATSIGLSTSFTAPALGKTMPPDIRDLIGMTNGSNTSKYPLGWIRTGDCTYGRSLVICSMLKNGDQQGLILQRQSYEPKRNGENVPAIITDAMKVFKPNSYDHLAFYCYFEGEELSNYDSFKIFSEVRFPKRCDIKTKTIIHAWTMNLETGKFERVSNTKGLLCEYGYTLRGEPEFRNGCPGYSSIPSE